MGDTFPVLLAGRLLPERKNDHFEQMLSQVLYPYAYDENDRLVFIGDVEDDCR